MKKQSLFLTILSVLLVAILSACGQIQTVEKVETVEVEQAQPVEEAVEVDVETEAETAAPAEAIEDEVMDAEAAPAEEAMAEAESAAPAAQGDRSDIRIVVVTHGQAADGFWSVVANGVNAAGADMEVTVEYQAPQTFDMVAMSQLIDAAIASEPDGLVVSIPDADALADPIRAAVEAGIPVISINSGSDVAQELGVLTHVGQTEYEAGYGGGQRMAEAGVTQTICINPEVGNVAQDQRCQGFADGVGAPSEVLAVDLSDPIDAQQRVFAALTANPDIDGIMALGFTSAEPALAAMEELGLTSEDVKLAGFDLSPEVLQAISRGDMLFTIDQQQYLQGYLPIVLLTLHNTNLNSIANDVVMTGPGFVTKDNADRIIELSAQGTR